MDTLQVQMFGGFALRFGDKPVLLKKPDSSKAARLLEMLLVAGSEGIAKSELLDNLYGWDERLDTVSRNRNLNNVIYRLKGILAAAGLPEENYVEIDGGVCRFVSSFPVETDVAKFAGAIARAQACPDGPERIACYEEANRLYVGELLPMNLTFLWIFEKNIYYKNLYNCTIAELEKEYRRNNDFLNLLNLYTRAAAIYPYEDWQVKQIRCNLEMYRYEEALEIYNQTMEMYARDMGNPPTEEMQRCFEEIKLAGAHHRGERRCVTDLRTMETIFMGREGNVIKTIFEMDNVSGAYYCTYPSFIDHCRVLVRNRKRHDPRAMLLFLTLTRGSRRSAPNQMDILKDAIGRSLRKGDTYTRYGNRHFILMLTDINKEDCGIVFERIERAYHDMAHGGGELWYHAAMTQELETAINGTDIAAKSKNA